MPFNEKVTSYTVALLKNQLVPYTRVIRLTTETGHTAFLAFEPHPRADWLQFVGNSTNVFLHSGEFDRTHRLLQTESPVFYTALNVVGLSAYNLSTSAEPLGEGPADDVELAEVARRVREGGE